MTFIIIIIVIIILILIVNIIINNIIIVAGVLTRMAATPWIWSFKGNQLIENILKAKKYLWFLKNLKKRLLRLIGILLKQWNV